MICQRRGCDKVVPRGSRWIGFCSAACAGVKQRACLGPGCGRMFLSTGPGHRLCDRCTRQQPTVVAHRYW